MAGLRPAGKLKHAPPRHRSSKEESDRRHKAIVCPTKAMDWEVYGRHRHTSDSTAGGTGIREQRTGEDRAGAQGRAAGDRKSTRLNSSHLGISYAVFCLKK